MELCEQASGARMHTALYRPHGFDFSVLSPIFIREVGHFLTRCARSLAGAFLGLLNNRSLKSRLAYVGQVSAAKVTAYGVTGLVARSCGVVYDLRLQGRANYSLYRSYALRVFIGRRGDNLDRFLLRVKEVSEGFRLLSQVLTALQPLQAAEGGSVRATSSVVRVRKGVGPRQRGRGSADIGSCGRPRVCQSHSAATHSPRAAALGLLGLGVTPPVLGKFTSMESLIAHFRLASEGAPTSRGFGYGGVESPKGEVGVALVSAGGVRPYRIKLRTPVSHNMHLIPTLSVGATFADFVATFNADRAQGV